jgi:hypothetical protein
MTIKQLSRIVPPKKIESIAKKINKFEHILAEEKQKQRENRTKR